MTREELYEFVWSTPLIHLARQFGVSDVALKKVCVKHNIPTPARGYWTRLEYGKSPPRPKLAPPPKGRTENLDWQSRPRKRVVPKIEAARAALARWEADRPVPVVATSERPDDLHQLTRRLERALGRVKPDAEEFLNISRKRLPAVSIGPRSIDRTVLIFDAFLKAVLDRGARVQPGDSGLQLVIEDEIFDFKFYETRTRSPHTPSEAELKRQAEFDARRARWPSLYSTDSKVIRSWDYAPSGRLSLQISDPTVQTWRTSNLVGRWRDRKTKSLDAYLNDVMVALFTAPALVKHRRAEEEREARERAAAEEARQREAARVERLRKRRAFFIERAAEHARLQELRAFAAHLDEGRGGDPSRQLAVVSRELGDLIEEVEGRLAPGSIAAQMVEQEILADEDLS